jgi:hypothetical protein
MPRSLDAIRPAFEVAGIVLIADNGGGRGVRFSVPTEETAVSVETGDNE